MSAEIPQGNLQENVRSEAEIVIVAASRKQADQLRRQADQMVRRSGTKVPRPRSEGLKGYELDGCLFELKGGYREIRLDDARMVVLAADADTADGSIPTLALVDELHRQGSIEMYEVLRKGLTAPPPAGRRGSLKDFERFCSLLLLDTGKPMELERHERKILRQYFAGVREIVVVIGGKNGKTTLLAALGLYHLKMGSPVRQMITISTAGIDEDSPLGRLRQRAHKHESFRRRGCLNTARTDDKRFAWLEWCLEPTDDRTDFDLVKKANPASWHTVESLRAEHNSPSQTDGFWARIHCGVWTAGEESWLEAPEWDALRVDIGGIAEGEQVYAAVVYGMNPAIAVAAARPEDVMLVEDEEETVEVLGAAVKVWVYEGKPRYTQLERELLNLAGIYDLAEVFYDPDQFTPSAEHLELRGLTMTAFPQRTVRMTQVTTTLQRIIHAEILRHDGDETLRAQMLRSVIKENTNGGRWLQPSDGSRCVVAMAVAVHQATQVATPPPKPLIVVGKVG